MGRSRRLDIEGVVYHVLNRGNGRMTIFEDEGDYQAFERVLEQALERYPQMQLLAYCVMPNHWHMVLRPTADGVLSKFVGWLRQAFFLPQMNTDDLRSRQNNV